MDLNVNKSTDFLEPSMADGVLVTLPNFYIFYSNVSLITYCLNTIQYNTTNWKYIMGHFGFYIFALKSLARNDIAPLPFLTTTADICNNMDKRVACTCSNNSTFKFHLLILKIIKSEMSLLFYLCISLLLRPLKDEPFFRCNMMNV